MKKFSCLLTGILAIQLSFGQVSYSPVIDVSPDSLSESLLPGQTSVQVLTISNNGDSTLNLSVSVDYPTGSPANYALEFNGENSYVNCGNNPSLDIANSMTFEAWFYAFDWNGNRRILQ